MRTILLLLLLLEPLWALAAGPAPLKSDAEIERSIRHKFSRSRIAASNFRVRVQGGVATIDGTTGVVQHKGAATRMAKSAGAKSVINRVKVSEAARRKAVEGLQKSQVTNRLFR